MLMLRQMIRSAGRNPQQISLFHAPRSSAKMSSISVTYKHLLATRPVLVQAIQAGTLMGAGDFIAQTFMEKTPLAQVNYWRTGQFFALGLFFVVSIYSTYSFFPFKIMPLVSAEFQGPTVRAWYALLARRVTHPNVAMRTLQKVAWDQFVFAPIFMGTLISIISFMQHQDLGRIKEKLRNEYVDVLLANYYVWPAVQLVNFRFVPLNYQVLLTQTVAVCWNIYISWKTNLSEKK